KIAASSFARKRRGNAFEIEIWIEDHDRLNIFRIQGKVVAIYLPQISNQSRVALNLNGAIGANVRTVNNSISIHSKRVALITQDSLALYRKHAVRIETRNLRISREIDAIGFSCFQVDRSTNASRDV